MSYTSWINWKISQDSTASQGLDSIFLPVLPIKRKWGWNICRETLLVVVTAITLPATVTIKVYALLYLVAEVEFLQGIEFLTSKTSTSLSVYSPVPSFLLWDLLLTISPTSQLQISAFSTNITLTFSVNHRLIDWITPKKKNHHYSILTLFSLQRCPGFPWSRGIKPLRRETRWGSGARPAVTLHPVWSGPTMTCSSWHPAGKCVSSRMNNLDVHPNLRRGNWKV